MYNPTLVEFRFHKDRIENLDSVTVGHCDAID